LIMFVVCGDNNSSSNKRGLFIPFSRFLSYKVLPSDMSTAWARSRITHFFNRSTQRIQQHY